MKKLPHRHLAEGEVTGHFHEAASLDTELFSDGNHMEMKSPNGTAVTHQEHHTVEVPPGNFDIIRVREYNHAEEEMREVRD